MIAVTGVVKLTRALSACLLLGCLIGWLAVPTSEAADGSGLKIDTVSFAPHCRLRPGRIMVVRAEVINKGEAQAEGILVARLDKEPTEEGARKIILAPGQRKFFELYIRVPANAKPGEYLIVTITLTAIEGNRQVVLSGTDSSIFQTLRLQVETEPVVTAILLDRTPREHANWDWKQQDIHDSYEMAVAARLDAEYSRRFVILDGMLAPCQMADWDTFDSLVIADDSRLEDEATLQSIKQWMHAGGRVWIMLDRVRCETVRGLLSEGQSCEEVDSIELNRFTLDPVERLILETNDRTHGSEVPIRLKRVVQTGGEVSQSINGWPAAIWMPAGHGQLLITTLGARGWLVVRANDPKKPPDHQGPFALARWAGSLAAGFFDPRPPLPLEDQVIDYPLRHIGNPVLPRSLVVVVLSGFCGLLIVLGVWQYSKRSLNRIGWIAPILGLLGVVPLLMASAWIRKDIPECVSRLQIAESLPGGDSMLVRDKMAVYMGQATDTRLDAKLDAVPVPPKAKLTSGIRRWTFDDFQNWHLTNVSWPTGLWRLDQEFVLPTKSMFVTARIGEEGVQLVPPEGLPSKLEDVVLSFVPGDPAICEPRSDGSYFVGASGAIRGEKWVTGSFVSDEQVRRIEVYKQLFDADRKSRVWAFPSLVGWSALLPNSPAWTSPVEQRGSALMSLRIKLQPVAPGQKVLIPHNLIRIYKPHTNVGMSPAFNEPSGKWNEPTTMSTRIVLRYVLPAEVVPIKAESIDVELQVRAPQRAVSLTCLAGKEAVDIGNWISPLGLLQVKLTDPRALAEIRNGSLNLTLDISDRQGAGSLDTSNVGTWEVDSLRINVRGETEPRVQLAR